MFSISILGVNFFVALSTLEFFTKIAIFVLAVVLLISAVGLLFRRNEKRVLNAATSQNQVGGNFDDGTKKVEDSGKVTSEKLASLEEINLIFGASLNSEDSFRLISNRISEIIPFAACVAYFPDESQNLFSAELFGGEHGKWFTNFLVDNENGVVGRCFANCETLIDEKVVLEKTLWNGFEIGIAAPLMLEENCFGVLALYSDQLNVYDTRTAILLTEIGVKVGDLLSKSFAAEERAESSLTDALTELPNQRAFYLMLEQQIAESLRYRAVRQLSILSIDIKEFSVINAKFGGFFGDHVLTVAATVIRNQLRQMDFLSRFGNDEFFAILPTAPKDVAESIAARIKDAIESFSIETPDESSMSMKLNIGHSSFLFDGETALELVQSARHRKEKAKINSLNPPAKVLNFPAIQAQSV